MVSRLLPLLKAQTLLILPKYIKAYNFFCSGEIICDPPIISRHYNCKAVKVNNNISIFYALPMHLEVVTL